MKINLLTKLRNLQILDPRRFQELIEQAAQEAGLTDSTGLRQINLVLVSRKKIRQINSSFLGLHRATDVIAFDLRAEGETPMSWPDQDETGPEETVDAEIYVCPEMADQAANRYQSTPEKETVLYIVHGLLHLAGHRDDSEDNQQKMRKAEQRILTRLQQQFNLAQLLRLTYSRRGKNRE